MREQPRLLDYIIRDEEQQVQPLACNIDRPPQDVTSSRPQADGSFIYRWSFVATKHYWGSNRSLLA
jgi:hypothetical protein